MSISPEQAAVCRRYGAGPDLPAPDQKLGISFATISLRPLHGLRHAPEGTTCGWYIWGGQHLEQDPDFFEPIHVAHLSECCPDALQFLALPPGWRFLVADGYEDVWQDLALLAPT
jgi:hypothetical protein